MHRPYISLKKLTPENCENLLFDDVLWPEKAAEEHDKFADLWIKFHVKKLFWADKITGNLYWVFSGQLPDESLVTLKRMLRWPAGELMEAAFIPVEDALKIEEVRPMTRLFLSLEQRRSDLKQMTWMNDDMDCIFRFV